MRVRVEHAAHCEDRKRLLPVLPQPTWVVEQRPPPPCQHLPHGAAQLGGSDGVEQHLRPGTSDHHTMFPQDVALDDGAALLRDIEVGGFDKWAGRVIGSPAANHLLGNIAPVEFPSPFVPGSP